MPRRRQQIHASLSNIHAYTHTAECTFSINSTPEGNLVIKTSQDSNLYVTECRVDIEYNPQIEDNGHHEIVDLNTHPTLFQELVRLKRYIDECEFIDTSLGEILSISFYNDESKSFLEFGNVLRVYFVLR